MCHVCDERASFPKSIPEAIAVQSNEIGVKLFYTILAVSVILNTCKEYHTIRYCIYSLAYSSLRDLVNSKL